MNKSSQVARKFIAQGNIDKAIKVLLDATEGEKLHKEVIRVSHKFKMLQNERIRGTLPPEKFNIKLSQIVKSLLAIIDDLEYGKRKNLPKSSSKPFWVLNIFIMLFVAIGDILKFIYGTLVNKPIERIKLILNKKKLIKVGNRLVKCAEINEQLVDEVAFIRSKESVTIKVIIEGDLESYQKTNAKEFVNSVKSELELRGNVNVKRIEKGSVVISLEMSSEDAEKLYLAIKLQKLKELEIKEAKLVGFTPVEQNEIKDIEEIKEKIKNEIAKNFEIGLATLENLLSKKSKHYNDLILVKSSYNQSNRMFNHGLIDFDMFKIQMNKFIKSLIDIVEELVGVDVIQKVKGIR